MAKYVHDNILDAALQYLIDNANKICLCSAEPTTYTEAVTTYMLGNKVISSANFGSIANGAVSGRKVTLAEVATIPVTTSGNVIYVALVDTTDSLLLYYWSVSSTAVVADAYAKVTATTFEIRDPS